MPESLYDVLVVTERQRRGYFGGSVKGEGWGDREMQDASS